MTAEQAIIFVVFPVAGYLLGSVPFAWVIGRAKGVDIRTVGSKNIGATNLGRTLGKKYFFYAFMLDAGKGFLPVLAVSLLVRQINVHGILVDTRESSFFSHTLGPPHLVLEQLPLWLPLLTAGACFLGHLFPIWLGFKGGKGVATGFGAVLGFWPLYTIAGLAAGAIFVCLLMVYKYISVASMGGAVGFALIVAWLANWNNRYVDTYLVGRDRDVVIGAAAFFALTIVWRHRGNIVRLMKGTEPQVGQREIDKAKMGK